MRVFEQYVKAKGREEFLVPQVIVRGYEVDFELRHPTRTRIDGKRVAIEIDGAIYHWDTVKDRIRQTHIENEGWVFYRIGDDDIASVGQMYTVVIDLLRMFTENTE